MDNYMEVLVPLIREYNPDTYIIDQRYSAEPPRFPSVSISLDGISNVERYSTFDRKFVVSAISLYVEIYGTKQECEDLSVIIAKCLQEDFRYNMTFNQPWYINTTVLHRRIMRFARDKVVK